MTPRVVIADDQAIVRAGLRVIIERDPDLTVVGEAATGDEAVALVRSLWPDVILMDIRMPALDGIEATRLLLGDTPSARSRVIVLTTFDTDEHIFDALRAGASGFLLKDSEPDELRRAIHVVAAGDALLAPSVTRRLVSAYTSAPPQPTTRPDTLSELTDREREVLTLVAKGMSNDAIAARLVISHTTAKTHISRAMTKLGLHDRAQLVIAAYESGLVRPTDPP